MITKYSKNVNKKFFNRKIFFNRKLLSPPLKINRSNVRGSGRHSVFALRLRILRHCRNSTLLFFGVDVVKTRPDLVHFCRHWTYKHRHTLCYFSGSGYDALGKLLQSLVIVVFCFKSWSRGKPKWWRCWGTNSLEGWYDEKTQISTQFWKQLKEATLSSSWS